MVTDQQVRRLRQKLMEGKKQEAAASASGMSVRSARNWQGGPLPSEKKRRRGRTRPDPFAGVWSEEIEPLLRGESGGSLQATTVLEWLQERHADRFSRSHLRTLQRRIRDWRALNGPEQEVFFPQRHLPGREAQLDFTHCDELGVIIAGEAFSHLLFEFVLSYSGWRFVEIAYGETFEALMGGLQGSLWSLGGVPEVVRTDNLSAATHELRHTRGRGLNERYGAVLSHYGLRSTRTNRGASHENGVVEQAHYRLKTAIDQALILRGSRDFVSVQSYRDFVQQIVDKRNHRIEDRLQTERSHLRPLPPAPVPQYTTYRTRVRKWSTIRVNSKTYSVPSRLKDMEVEVRQYHDHIEVYYKGHLVESMNRLRGGEEARINYRHVIRSLVKKPGAFARYRFKDQLFPTQTFRRTYDALQNWRGERADVEYLRILHLAATTMESEVEQALSLLLISGDPFDYMTVRGIVAPVNVEVPQISSQSAPDLTVYDALITGVGI